MVACVATECQNPPAGLDEVRLYTRTSLLATAHDSAVDEPNEIRVRVELIETQSYNACQE